MIKLCPVSTTFKLEELAEKAGVSPRTVRYYVQRGLLRAPEFRGRDTAYTDDHLLRLRAIRKLQDRFLPLDAIQAELTRLDDAGLKAVVEGSAGMAPPVELPRALPPDPYRPPQVLMPAGERLTRVEIAPGLELSISDGADARARALFEEIVQQHMKGSRK
jgi:DNA-binding transcriptional MerR regulator